MCRIVFSSRKKTLKKGEMVHRKFVLSEETFVFGPLLCGKTRERWREREQTVLKLVSDAVVSCCFSSLQVS